MRDRYVKTLLAILLLTINVLSATLQEPTCIKANIDFWEDVYTKYSKNQGIFHDKNSFKIYLIKDLPENTKKRSSVINFTLDSLRKKNPGIEFRLQSGVKEQFDLGIKRSKLHLPYIMSHFSKNNIPEEIAYLPFVESAFNVNAISKVKARGMFQIMPKTGKIYGCKNPKNLHDPKIATEVAAKILLDNYNETGTWELALISYNHGVEGMKRAKIQLNTENHCTIIDNYRGKSFKFASKNFLAQFFAVQRIIKCLD